jgi:hypothetical protein
VTDVCDTLLLGTLCNLLLHEKPIHNTVGWRTGEGSRLTPRRGVEAARESEGTGHYHGELVKT